jgi:hypothetical protein
MDLKKISELNLWFKLRGDGSSYTLFDIPELIPSKWQYFKENWLVYRETLLINSVSYVNSDALVAQVKKMDYFIESRRNYSANPFSSDSVFSDFSEIFSLTSIDISPLNRTEEDVFRAKIKKVSEFNKQTFIDFRNELTSNFLILADRMGLSDDTTDKLYNRSALPQQFDPQISLIDSSQQFLQLINATNAVIANFYKSTSGSIDYFSIIRENLKNPQIPVDTYSSAYLALVQPNATIQEIARTYLGNPDRYLEIAAANNLKPPYIDEVGFTIPLLSNGNKNKINLPRDFGTGLPTIQKIFRGQVILLQSDSLKKSETRTVINIQEVPVSGEIILELSGNPDLDKFKISQNATIRVFRPNTTNSNFFILIPSVNGVSTTPLHETPWFMQNLTYDEKKSGVDLKIDPYGDLVFENSGDFSLNYGLSNAIQAVKIKMATEKGELVRHPNFGLTPQAGRVNVSVSEIQNFISNELSDQISSDDRFNGLERLSVALLDAEKNAGRSLFINFSVRLAGGNTAPIPITFTTNLK